MGTIIGIIIFSHALHIHKILQYNRNVPDMKEYFQNISLKYLLLTKTTWQNLRNICRHKSIIV